MNYIGKMKKIIISFCALILTLNSMEFNVLADTIGKSPEGERLQVIDLKNKSQEEIKNIFERYGVMYEENAKYEKLEIVLPDEGELTIYNDKGPITGIYNGKSYIISYKHTESDPVFKTNSGVDATIGALMDTGVSIGIGLLPKYIWIPYALFGWVGLTPSQILSGIIKEAPENVVSTRIDKHMIEKTFAFIVGGRAIPYAAMQRAEVTDNTSIRLLKDKATSRYITKTAEKTTFYEYPYYRNNSFGLARALEQISPYGFVGRPDSKVHTLSYRAHIQNKDWQQTREDGEVSGTVGSGLRLEAIKMNINSGSLGGSIQYRTHVQNIGWQNFVQNGALSGTSGQSLRLEAIQIRLTGGLTGQYDVRYRVHVQDYGWQDWVRNGATAGTVGQGKRLEAIQVQLRPK